MWMCLLIEIEDYLCSLKNCPSVCNLFYSLNLCTYMSISHLKNRTYKNNKP